MDPIADFINRLVNAGAARKREVVVPFSKMKQSIADVLLREGYIEEVKTTGKTPATTMLKVILKFGEDGAPHIKEVKRLSKPSRRKYARVSDIRPVRNGVGTLVISTPKGILTDKDAKKESVGGELLFTIW